ncbi:MAG TPA: hypothetical protein VMV10_12300 [Pirellulales bacterium]|nr:hypothetical protein [Pirellulales bacterium]
MMMSAIVATDLETIDRLILARMLFSATPQKARDDAGKLAAAQFSPGEWAEAFEPHWRRLVEAELLRPKPGPGRKPGKSFELTDEGRRQALAFLQIGEPPARLNWATVQSSYLLPLAMNLRPGSREAEQLKKAASLKLALVARSKGLALPAGAKAKQALAALAWKVIGVESNADFTAENVIQQLVFRQKPARKLTADQVATALAAAAVGARTKTPAELRLSAIRRWLSPTIGPKTAPAEPNLATFAEQTLNAARRISADRRFGDNKAFISHVWRQLRGEAAFDGLALEAFKQRLVEANREGLVRLSRADLVEAMDPADVEESATAYENATFHFIRL